MGRRTVNRWFLLVALPLLLAVPGCAHTNRPPPPEVYAGGPDRGATLIARYGCDSCRTIPGMDRADGLVGPPLSRFDFRSYIVGKLVNNADNPQHWIIARREVEPSNAITNLGVSQIDAQDTAAYLYTQD